eukprot:9467206-Pyramimonas_sp.AAC.1
MEVSGKGAESMRAVLVLGGPPRWPSSSPRLDEARKIVRLDPERGLGTRFDRTSPSPLLLPLYVLPPPPPPPPPPPLPPLP